MVCVGRLLSGRHVCLVLYSVKNRRIWSLYNVCFLSSTQVSFEVSSLDGWCLVFQRCRSCLDRISTGNFCLVCTVMHIVSYPQTSYGCLNCSLMSKLLVLPVLIVRLPFEVRLWRLKRKCRESNTSLGHRICWMMISCILSPTPVLRRFSMDIVTSFATKWSWHSNMALAWRISLRISPPISSTKRWGIRLQTMTRRLWQTSTTTHWVRVVNGGGFPIICLHQSSMRYRVWCHIVLPQVDEMLGVGLVSNSAFSWIHPFSPCRHILA